MKETQEQKDQHNCYNFVNGELCFIAVGSGRPFSRPMNDEVREFLLFVLHNRGRLLESGLVALNRWIMRSDKEIDFAHSKSKKGREIKIMPALAEELTGRKYGIRTRV